MIDSNFVNKFTQLFDNYTRGNYNLNQEDFTSYTNEDAILNNSNSSISIKLVKDLKEIAQMIKTQLCENELSIEYSIIAKKVYINTQTDVADFIELLKKSLSEIDEDEKVINILLKMIYNADLACVQKAELYSSLDNRFSGEVKTLGSEAKKLEEQLEKLTKKANRLEGQSTEFIAILGVFSSFVFVMFAGFDSLAKILDNLGSTSASLPRTILIAMILVNFIVTIVYFLLFYISKIIGRTMVDKVCDCKNVCKNIKHIIAKHRFYLAIVTICTIIGGVCAFIEVICAITCGAI